MLKLPVTKKMFTYSAGFALAFLANSSSWSLEAVSGPTLIMDPNGATPLAGVVELETDVPARVKLVVGNGTDKWSVQYKEYRTSHAVPLLGLKPDDTYTVSVVITDRNAQSVQVEPALEAMTGPLPADFPVIEVIVSNPAKMEPGFTLMDKFSRGPGAQGSSLSVIVDNTGTVVWYSSLGGGAMKQLDNGHLFYRVNETATEIDMLGTLVKETPLDNLGRALHHDLFRTSHGTYLSLSNQNTPVDDFPTSDTNPNAPTTTAIIDDDPVVEFALDGSLINEWPLLELIDPVRVGYGVISTSSPVDWAHANAVIHDPRDDSIIVSVRHQDAVVKFDRATGLLKWILAPHANWAPEYQPFLLQPVGTPFAWQYHQHAPMITRSGTLVLFDNGNFRASPFDGTDSLPALENYSRAVEYAINEQTMEVSQVWEYGTDIPERLYADFIGDADSLPITGNTLINFGGTQATGGVVNDDIGRGAISVRLVEVDHGTPAERVFDMAMYNPAVGSRISVYRAERIPSLYPPFATVVPDSDGDGVLDDTDNCLAIYNAAQQDTDGDGHGNACDADLNNDCNTNAIDLGLFKAVFFTNDSDADMNSDGVVNAVDLGALKSMFFSAPGPSAAGTCSA